MCLRKTTTHLASLQPIFAQSSLPIAEYVISKESFVASYYWTVKGNLFSTSQQLRNFELEIASKTQTFICHVRVLI